MPDEGGHGTSSQPNQPTLLIRVLGRAAIPALVAGAALAATATVPAIADLHALEAATGVEATVGFTSTQLIMIVGGLLTAVTGALSLMFRQLLQAQQKVYDAQLAAANQQQSAHSEALKLKDETIASVRERLHLKDQLLAEKDKQLEVANASLEKQAERMLSLLEGTVQGTREVLMQVKETLADNSIATNSVAEALKSHTSSSDTLLTNLTQAISRIQDAWGTRPQTDTQTWKPSTIPQPGPA